MQIAMSFRITDTLDPKVRAVNDPMEATPVRGWGQPGRFRLLERRGVSEKSPCPYTVDHPYGQPNGVKIPTCACVFAAVLVPASGP